MPSLAARGHLVEQVELVETHLPQIVAGLNEDAVLGSVFDGFAQGRRVLGHFLEPVLEIILFAVEYLNLELRPNAAQLLGHVLDLLDHLGFGGVIVAVGFAGQLSNGHHNGRLVFLIAVELHQLIAEGRRQRELLIAGEVHAPRVLGRPDIDTDQQQGGERLAGRR